MKRKTILTYLVILLTMTSFRVSGQNKYLPFTQRKMQTVNAKAPENLMPKRSVNTTRNSATISYSFIGGTVSEMVGMDKNNYEFIHVEGFGKMAEIGKPALPSHNDILATPGNNNPTIEIISSEFIEYKDYTIHPALPPARDTEGKDQVEFKKDPKTYSTDKFYPENIVEISEVLEYRGNYFSSVRICPVQYNPVKKTIRVYSEITYRINYAQAKKSTNNGGSLLKGLVLNSEALQLPQQKSSYEGKDPNYLVIARSDYAESANMLARWKSQLGYRTEVILKEHWESPEVKNAIHTRFAKYSPSPVFFVIIGDHDQVPAEILIRAEGNIERLYASDLYYACTGGPGDYYPDMAKGRIPANTPEQAVMMVNKGIEYEKNPVEDPDFYKNGLNCAQFQDTELGSPRDGIASRRFCLSSEEVRDYMMSLGYNIERIYYTDSLNTPTHYNNRTYSSGGKIPDELLKSNGFAWDGDEEDILREINEGKFFVLHRDHGFEGAFGWAHPNFRIPDVYKLRNGRQLPVIFSMNCHTGEFLIGTSFAESLLRNENGGAVGVFAASYYSFSGYNDGLTAGMINTIWPDPGYMPDFGTSAQNVGQLPGHDDNANTMGEVLNQGLIRMRETWSGNQAAYEYTHRLYHFFGDPALRMWLGKPEKITANYSDTLSCGATAFSITDISINSGTATIVQGDSLIAKTEFNSKTVSLTFAPVNDSLPVVVTISAPGRKPLTGQIIVSGCENAPVPDFATTVQTIVNSPDNLRKIALVNNTSYNADIYKWSISPASFEFVDGTSESSKRPVVVFNEEGTYSITLDAGNANGSNSLTKTDYLNVIFIHSASCKPKSNNIPYNVYGIWSFEVNGFEKRSGAAMNDYDGKNDSYMDFTTDIITVKKGHETPFIVEGAQRRNENMFMFIDYNNDGEFDMNTEKVSELNNFNGRSSGTFTVKENPQNKYVRLRLISEYLEDTITDGCYSPAYGQVEDYTVTFVDAEPVVEIVKVHQIDYDAAMIDAHILTNGNNKITERGIIYTTDTTLPLSAWTEVASPATERKFTQQITQLDESTVYFAKAYATNSFGRVYSENTLKLLTYSVAPPAHYPTDITVLETTSSIIHLTMNEPVSGALPYGYLVKWSTTGFDDIIDPKDGYVEPESESVMVVPYGTGEILLDSLDDATTYFIKIYPYINGEDKIKYKKDGIVPHIKETTYKFGEFPPVSFGSANTLNYIRFNTLYNAGERTKDEYHDFRSTHETTVAPNSMHKIQVGTQPGETRYYVNVWADWNKNGKFEDSERTYLGDIYGTMVTDSATSNCPGSHPYPCGEGCYTDSAQAASAGCYNRINKKAVILCPTGYPYECGGKCYTDSVQAASDGCFINGGNGNTCPASHPFACGGNCYTDSAQAVSAGCISPEAGNCPSSHPFECNGNCYEDKEQAKTAGCHNFTDLETAKIAGDITVQPSTKGWTTMRVVYSTDQNATPIPHAKYGSVEDYKIWIDPEAKTPGLWLGDISKNWNEPGNWDDNKVPSKFTTVQIYTGEPNYPEINSDATAGSIFIEGEASLDVLGNANLQITEDLFVNDLGLFVHSAGKTTIGNHLNIGNANGGNVYMLDGELNVNNHIFTSAYNSFFNMSGGKLNATSWNGGMHDEYGVGEVLIEGGEINIDKLMLYFVCRLYIENDPVININRELKIGSYYDDRILGGTFVFKGKECEAFTPFIMGNFYAWNIVIEDSSKVYFAGPRWISPVTILGDLTVKGEANFVDNGRPVYRTNIGGNAHIQQGGKWIVQNQTAVKEDLTVDGEFVTENARFEFNGTEEQNIRWSSEIPQVTISNPAGAALSGNITIADKITLNNSPLRLNGHALTLQQNAVIENASALSYPDVIISEKSGEIRKVINQEATSLYLPLGDTSDYLPIEAEITEANPSDKYISFSMMNNTDSLFGDKETLKRAWNIKTEDGFGNFKLDATLPYTDADLGNLDENNISPVMYAEDAFVPVGSLIPEENKLSVSTSETGIFTAAVPSNKKGTSSLNQSYANKSKNGISVYPNPSNGKFSILLENPSAGELHIRITNAAGQLIASYKERNTKKPEVDLSGIKKGLYYIELIGNEFNAVEKVILK